jgi:hypothetical protein
MLDVICWKWKQVGYPSQFGPETVNTLRRMVARHLMLPHRFSCITDDSKGIDSDIRVIPLGDVFANIPNPSKVRGPSCYRRLKMFSPEAKELIGERIVSMDLDVVVTGDLTELFDRPDEFVIWGGQSVQPGRGGNVFSWYNGSLMMLKAGSRTQVWTNFDPVKSPQLANTARCRGTDQGWLSYCLGKQEKIWGTLNGVYSFRNHIQPNRGYLPANARFVAFHGAHDPWMPEIQRRYPWVREHYH